MCLHITKCTTVLHICRKQPSTTVITICYNFFGIKKYFSTRIKIHKTVFIRILITMSIQLFQRPASFFHGIVLFYLTHL